MAWGRPDDVDAVASSVGPLADRGRPFWGLSWVRARPRPVCATESEGGPQPRMRSMPGRSTLDSASRVSSYPRRRAMDGAREGALGVALRCPYGASA